MKTPYDLKYEVIWKKLQNFIYYNSPIEVPNKEYDTGRINYWFCTCIARNEV